MGKRILAIMASLSVVGVILSGFGGCGKKNKSKEVNREEKKVEEQVNNTSAAIPENPDVGFEKEVLEEKAKDETKSGTKDEELKAKSEPKKEGTKTKSVNTKKNKSDSVAYKQKGKSTNKKGVTNLEPAPTAKESQNKEPKEKINMEKIKAFIDGLQKTKAAQEPKKGQNAVNKEAPKPAENKVPEKVEKPKTDEEAPKPAAEKKVVEVSEKKPN